MVVAGSTEESRFPPAAGRVDNRVVTERIVEVVCIGLATQDRIALVPEHPAQDGRVLARDLQCAGGGPAATAAVALARLGHRVAFIGAVGDDPTGGAIRLGLEREGVDIAGLTVVPGARSPESLILAATGSATRSITAFPGTTGPLRLSASALARCEGARWVHVDHLGYAVTATLPPGGPSGPQLSVDGGNPIDGLDLRGIDLYVPTQEALRERYGRASLDEALRAALDDGAGSVVATLGGHGSRAATGDGGRIAAPAYETRLTSTLGAGDVFHGALLAGLLEDRSLEEAMRRANVAAALSCRGLDGRSAIPTRVELDEACGSVA